MSKTGLQADLRLLKCSDASMLGQFFDRLSAKTRDRFGPHDLSANFATELCQRISDDSALRYVLICDSDIIGYFILERKMSVHEAERYAHLCIAIVSGDDLLFAPCIADGYQNSGFASQVMRELIQVHKNKVKSFVLMGGTQETNNRARRFYQKFGFKEFGGYQTDVYNIDMRLVF